MTGLSTRSPPPRRAALRSHLCTPPDLAQVVDDALGPRAVTIRAADTDGHRSSANVLVHTMYATRGYRMQAGDAAVQSELVTLIACDDAQTLGTISIRFDSPDGLHADALFGSEVDALRAQGRRPCEFTKLAMDQVLKSKRVLASLFHTAFIWAHRVMAFDDVVIEVNPRHVRFYQRSLGFVVAGPQRHNLRVDAPAVLMRLDLAHARAQIDREAGRPGEGGGHSLYPHFFPAAQEAGLVARILRMH